MGLVDYSSGSDSDSEQPPPAPPPAPKSSLSAFLPKPKKRAPPATTADASAPKKIVVNLQKFSNASPDDLPPTKKPRITGSSGSGLSGMLPAPKKREATAAPVVKQRVLGGGNAPPRPEVVMHGDDDEEEGGEAEVKREKPQATSTQNTRFVPQSVARKQIQPMSAFRKKKVVGKSGDVKAAPVPAPVKQKVSLFGAAPTVGTVKPVQMNRGPEEYTPIMLEAPKPMQQPVGEVGGLEEVVEQVREPERVVNDIQTLAEDVGLDEDTLRQMYGRRGKGKEPITFSNFSVDQEYQKNELARSLGLIEDNKPVRAIAPGRHQLKTLLTSAQQQQGALEDQFASGKANRKEASSKYGW